MHRSCENTTSIEMYLTTSRPDNLLSDEVTVICLWIMYTILGQGLEMFGIGTNVINIVIFIKQGLQDPVNISLLGLAVSDIGCLSTVMWTNICYTPAFEAMQLPFHSVEIAYLTSGVPHTVFTRITGWITALITLERCLCIAAPLKVKSIVTSKRMGTIIISFFIISISGAAPAYVVNRLGEKFYPDLNKTLIGIVYMQDRDIVENISYIINNVSIPFSTFIVIIVCTIVLVHKLRSNTKWRQLSTTNVQGQIVSDRNQRVAKRVVVISTLSIICFIPMSIVFMALLVEPELFLLVNGKHKNILLTLGGFSVILESINSSMNIFIYYKLSSKYRAVFYQTFLRCSGEAEKVKPSS